MGDFSAKIKMIAIGLSNRLQMENLKTNSDLLDKLKRATRQVLSENEIQRQRASFIFGAINSDNDVTTEKVEEILARHEGRNLGC
jgi:hypothetical protein